eukprot:10099158-Karenia_brevis.AAC.1
MGLRALEARLRTLRARLRCTLLVGDYPGPYPDITCRVPPGRTLLVGDRPGPYPDTTCRRQPGTLSGDYL